MSDDTRQTETASVQSPARASAMSRFLGAGILPRLAVTLLGVPCLYLITLRGGLFFLILTDLIIILGLREFYALMNAKGYRPFEALGYFCSLALSWYAWKQGVVIPLVLTGSLLLIMIREVFRRDMSQSLAHIAVTVFGIMYIGWLGSHLVMLRELPASLGLDSSAGQTMGARLVFFAALVTWATDTGAYLFGVALGRHKLIPRISPNKTVEGAVGGLLAAGLVAWLCTKGITPFLTPFAAISTGVFVGLMAQLGDLVESMIKRDVGIKDSAELIPGHGGILDRFDSLLFTVPVLYYYFRFFIV